MYNFLASPLLSLVATGTESTPAPSTTVVNNIITEIPNVVTMMIDLMTDLLSNPFFCFLFACGFVRIGLGLIKKAKRASR